MAEHANRLMLERRARLERAREAARLMQVTIVAPPADAQRGASR